VLEGEPDVGEATGLFVAGVDVDALPVAVQAAAGLGDFWEPGSREVLASG
jgi:hypothetical protein